MDNHRDPPGVREPTVLSEGTIRAAASQLPEDGPFRLRYDRATGQTVLLTRQFTSAGMRRSTVVPTVFADARQLFEATAEFEWLSVQYARTATAIQLVLLKEWGVPEDELEAALDRALAGLYPDDSRRDATESAASLDVVGPVPLPVPGGVESRIALVMKTVAGLGVDLEAQKREALAAQIAAELGCAPRPTATPLR
ncbi:hypothetical protein LO772_08150 [Yinghuangia sp. ASG 101]|uniref:hypothetical protein n=1 Tax=Yinghuangia sp. ASG 101 TaxID=2896848 RepID=UPI001E5E3D6A|nr:hypothetical protein [Yinghuangia sp. ASG 101]UGQ13565.1 hypothetical protein LO772_08150 [Yinghuangia sp. ASG 101]